MAEDFLSLIAEYRAGLEAELTLLHRLESLAGRHREATIAGDLNVLHEMHDARDRIMLSLVSLEHDLKPARSQLVEHRHRLKGVTLFQAVAALHAEAADMVARIIASDQESMAALHEAEHARRAAAEVMERGESTLQAYRRVVAPAASNASLVDRRG
jgi:hypothetical protein